MRFLKRQTINRRQLKSTTVYSDVTDANVYINPKNAGSMVLPIGTDAQIPASPINGMMRYNTDHSEVQVYQSSKWRSLKFKESSPIVQQSLGAGDSSTVYFGPLSSSYNPTNTSSNVPVSGGAGSGQFGGQNMLIVVENIIQLFNTNYTVVQNPTSPSVVYTPTTSVAALTSATTIYFNSSLVTTGASGNSTTATLTFDTQPAAPFSVGATIVVSGVTPSAYNGSFTVTASSASTVSYSSSATGSMSFSGTVTAASPTAAVFTGTDLVGAVVTGSASLQSNTVIVSYVADATTDALLSITIDKPLITATIPAGTALTLTEPATLRSGYYLFFSSPVPYGKPVTALIGFDQ